MTTMITMATDNVNKFDILDKDDLSTRDEDWEKRITEDAKYNRELQLTFKRIRADALRIIDYFEDSCSVHKDRFAESAKKLVQHLDLDIEPGVDHIIRIAHLFDWSPLVPANGYRSIILVIHKCSLRILDITQYVLDYKESYFFRANHYSRELEAFVACLGQLRACMYYLQRIVPFCKDGDLFPDQEKLSEEDYQVAESLMIELEALSQTSFYGRCLAFQFCNSMIKPLTTIIVAMASYSDGYTQESKVLKLASQVIGGGRYLLDPDARADQIVNITRNGDIHFCKSFWQIAESDLMHSLPLFVCPAVALDKVIHIAPMPFELPLCSGEGKVKITPPCAHHGPDAVPIRLISCKLRAGQQYWKDMDVTDPRSSCLIIQAHGGGFVAQSSASHQVYLRHWAKSLDIPILCVDYSLAPESQFPRQLEEMFFAYCWALKNAGILGWTGEHVCLVGDSAGGNLIIATAMRVASYGIQPPSGLVSIYGTTLIKFAPSPSRMLSLMDPLLPIGVVASCLAAYVGVSDCGSGSMTPQRNNASFSMTPVKSDGDSPNLPASQMSSSDAVDQETRSSQRSHLPLAGNPVMDRTKLHLNLSSSMATPPEYAQVRHFVQSPVHQFRHLATASNPFMSPLLAREDQLKSLPPVHLIACHLDPMLDDSVAFAKLVRRFDVNVSLSVLPGLPHGFLNFCLVSQEAKEGSDLCMEKIMQVFGRHQVSETKASQLMQEGEEVDLFDVTTS